MKIRKATLKDIEGLMQLQKEAKKEFKDWTLIKEKEFADLIKKKLVYVAENKNKVVAYVSVKTLGKKIIFYDIYLKKELRRKGIGRKLMDRLLNDLKKTNFRNVSITCPAIIKRFKERFKIVKGRKE